MTGPNVMRVAPAVLWAQRKDRIFLTINVRECPKNYKLNIESKKIIFSGKNEQSNKEYVLDLELYGEVNSEKYKMKASDADIQLCLTRAEEGHYWPRLIETKTKCHFLKTDFNKWKDEDETDDEDESANWENMMNNMNIGGTELGSEDEIADSDDDDLPDLEDDKDIEKLE